MTITNSYWATAVSGNFNRASFWTPIAVPDSSNVVDLDATGAGFTVTSSIDNTVDDLILDSDATLDIAADVFTISPVSAEYRAYNDGTINIGPGASMLLGKALLLSEDSGYFLNAGDLNLAGRATDPATLDLMSPLDVFADGGNLVLSGDADINSGGVQITSGETQGTSFARLVNYNNTISGSGTIGGDSFGLTNDDFGTIDADAASALTLSAEYAENTGVIETTGAGGLDIKGFGDVEGYAQFSNDGTLTADGTGVLRLADIYISGNGVAKAVKSGASILLDNGTINNGMISTVAGSSIVAEAGTSDALYCNEYDNAGSLVIGNGSVLQMGADVFNTGSISVDGSSAASELEIAGYSALFGSGKVVLGGDGDLIVSNGADAELVNLGNTIEGSGTLGDANFTLNNIEGTIDANGAHALKIDTGANEIVNDGTIISNSTAGIDLISTHDTPADPFLDNGGYLIANKGTINVEGYTFGEGVAEINGAAEIEFGSGGLDVVFGKGADGALRLYNSKNDTDVDDAFSGAVSGFTSSDKIDLSNILDGGSNKPSLTYSGNAYEGALTVTDGTLSTTIAMIGAYTKSAFSLESDGHGGTFVL